METTWNEDLRYDYPLNKDSVVFDIGGFDGTWAQTIYSKYGCNILVFEPVKEFCDSIKGKFQPHDTVGVYNYGLGTKDEILRIGVIGSATSVFNKSEKDERVQIFDIEPIISAFAKIDLLKMNIEGAEYDLLEYIIKRGLQNRLVNIQIQFHNNITDYENRRKKIREALAETHHLTYDFPVGLHENWEVN